MKMEKVNSSNIGEIGYDEKEKVMEIKFKSGTRYRYFDVKKADYVRLREASSIGKEFHVLKKTLTNFKKI